jgi:hypothetical protein
MDSVIMYPHSIGFYMEIKDKVKFKEGDEWQIQNKRREDGF